MWFSQNKEGNSEGGWRSVWLPKWRRPLSALPIAYHWELHVILHWEKKKKKDHETLSRGLSIWQDSDLLSYSWSHETHQASRSPLCTPLHLTPATPISHSFAGFFFSDMRFRGGQEGGGVCTGVWPVCMCAPAPVKARRELRVSRNWR